ncbi:MAG: antirestriction protein, partial [Desulfobacterales bacterium]|nr:antirestriction protein [Desulfobacterales bacterium]
DASHVNSTASYLKGWLERINEDITLLPWASQEAQKAVDLILDGSMPSYDED